jgi:hypothetical protein
LGEATFTVEILSCLYYLLCELNGPLSTGPILVYFCLEGGITICHKRCVDHGGVQFFCFEDLELFIGHRSSGILVRTGMKGIRNDRASKPKGPF